MEKNEEYEWKIKGDAKKRANHYAGQLTKKELELFITTLSSTKLTTNPPTGYQGLVGVPGIPDDYIDHSEFNPEIHYMDHNQLDKTGKVLIRKKEYTPPIVNMKMHGGGMYTSDTHYVDFINSYQGVIKPKPDYNEYTNSYVKHSESKSPVQKETSYIPIHKYAKYAVCVSEIEEGPKVGDLLKFKNYYFTDSKNKKYELDAIKYPNFLFLHELSVYYYLMYKTIVLDRIEKYGTSELQVDRKLDTITASLAFHFSLDTIKKSPSLSEEECQEQKSTPPQPKGTISGNPDSIYKDSRGFWRNAVTDKIL